MVLIWMPPSTTVPPLRTEARAAGSKAPTGAKMMAASSSTGDRSCELPAHTASELSGKVLAPRCHLDA